MPRPVTISSLPLSSTAQRILLLMIFLILIFTLTPILRKKITSSIQYPNPEIPNRVGQARLTGNIPTFLYKILARGIIHVNHRNDKNEHFVTLHNFASTVLAICSISRNITRNGTFRTVAGCCYLVLYVMVVICICDSQCQFP